MVIGSGRHVSCHNCGRLFPEGDCRSWYCSSKCQQEDQEKKKVLEAQTQAEIVCTRVRKSIDEGKLTEEASTHMVDCVKCEDRFRNKCYGLMYHI